MRSVRTGGGAALTLRAGRLSWTGRPRALVVTTGCVLLTLAGAVAAIGLGGGEYPMSFADVLRVLTGGGQAADVFVVQELRLPRAATALLVGAAFGLSGAVFQSVVRNPLGSPDILGFTSGSATGALLAITVVGGSAAAVAGGAVLGCVATGLLMWALTWRHGLHSYRLVLTGIGLTAILTGVNGYLLTKAKIIEASRAVLWLTGSLDGRGWDDALPLLAALAVLGPLVLLGCGRALRMLEMGDDAAAALGVRVERVRLLTLGAAVLLVAVAAAAAGPVGFVALTAPQLARRMTRAAGPGLASSAVVGALLLVAADLAAQLAFPGDALPVGVVTGVLGGGYLVWLLATQRKAGRI